MAARLDRRGARRECLDGVRGGGPVDRHRRYCRGAGAPILVSLRSRSGCRDTGNRPAGQSSAAGDALVRQSAVLRSRRVQRKQLRTPKPILGHGSWPGKAPSAASSATRIARDTGYRLSPRLVAATLDRRTSDTVGWRSNRSIARANRWRSMASRCYDSPGCRVQEMMSFLIG